MKQILLFLVVLLCSLTLPTAAKAGVVLNSTNFPDANFRAYVSTKTGVAVNGTISDDVISNQIYFNCSNKSIASLQGIEYFTALQTLYCRSNQLTALDVTHNTALKDLDCYDNQLSALDLTHNTALEKLNCQKNQLTALDVTHNTALKDLTCNINQLTALDVSHNAALIYLSCSANPIYSLDVTKNVALAELYCDNAIKSKALDVSHNAALIYLSCDSDSLSVDVTHNTALKTLFCEHNQLTALDLTHNTALIYLDCQYNHLTSLDLTYNPALDILWCSNNQFKKLDVTHNTELTQFMCAYNQLTSLDLTHNPALNTLWCNTNHLAELDLSKNTTLDGLSCANNSRTIKVYKYTRSAANGGGIGYYVPLTAQAATTDNPATKALATLIDDAGQSGDPAFNISRVVADSWGFATPGTFNGTQVLYLDTLENKFYYKYKSGFTGSATQWSTNYSAVAPQVSFTLQWDPSQVVTGVDGVEGNDVSVYTVNGAINVGGSFDGNVNVYNLRGQQVYCGTDSEIAVPAGMYIVKVNGKAHKVLVR
jgi:hypothetical protein